MFKSFSLAKAIPLVFVASACTMVIELIAGRLLAPYIGVSLYTWTSIIGVVLAGISLGNFLGGRLGDKHTSPLVLSIIFFMGAILSLAILPITILLKNTPLPASYHLMSRATIYTFVLFFLPTTVLGMVTPIVIKLTLKDLGNTANVVGTIYAISTAGSILGTFLTGFWLISWFGTRTIVWQVAAVLFILGLICTAFWRSRVKLGSALAVLVVSGLVFMFRAEYQSPYLAESNYYTINVFDTVAQGREVKAVSLDHLIHSYVDPNDPTFHGYDYEKTFAGIARYVSITAPFPAAMFIGGGGYAFNRYMEFTYPGATLDVVEIDPAVTRIAHEQLGLAADTRIVTYNEDARIFLIDRKSGPKYDLVVGDAFNDMSIPYHLTTYEFNEEVRKAMAPNGIYMINVIDNLRTGQFARSMMTTLAKSFDQVYLYLPNGVWPGAYPSTYVIMATNGDFKPVDFFSFMADHAQEYGAGTLVTVFEMDTVMGPVPSVFLTDDHVPVDNMIAPLFASR